MLKLAFACLLLFGGSVFAQQAPTKAPGGVLTIYEKEPMTKLDKALFAFASYNAGAGKISQLRKEAARRGHDPNVWFQIVEYVVAEKIGQETVTYVSNIYKYYIAYRLILESQAQRKESIEKVKGSAK